MTTEEKKKPTTLRRKNAKRVGKTNRNRFNDADIVNILKQYHVEKMGITEIAKKFKSSRQTIYKVLKTHDAPVSAKGMMVYDPGEVLGRAKMDIFARAKMLSEDTMQVCEISMNLIKHELACLSDSMKGGGSLKEQGIDTERFIDKLTKFFQAAAPYSIERKDGKAVPDSTPDSQLHKLMNKKLEINTKPN